MLKFIGIGSAFNTRLGNNSAFIKEGQEMLLIDCGGTVFQGLQQLDLLQGISKFKIMITHTHPDHIGSLGEVIFYCYYILKIKVEVFYPNEALIKSYLHIIGVTEDMYVLNGNCEVNFELNGLGLIHAQWVQQVHVDTIPAYGFILNTEKQKLYYSGDSSQIPDEIIEKLENGELDVIYQDSCGLNYEGNAHLYLYKLADKIQLQYRKQVYCMHLDQHIKMDEIRGLGFNVVERESVPNRIE